MFVEVTSKDELSRTLAAREKLGIDTLVLGGGTNVLVSDDGFGGLVIRLNLSQMEIDRENCLVRVGAGVSTSLLVEKVVEAGLKGLEFAAGLPGTVGGAIAGNAGCFGHALSDFLGSAEIVEPDGAMRMISDMTWFDFSYRKSRFLSGGDVLAEATFKLEPGDPEEMRREADEYVAVRVRKHPPEGVLTAGSYFKNLPPDQPGGPRQAAGALLDQVGAKELSVGDASVFEHHANIVINRGGASARDVLSLAREMARRVRERFSVELVEEVRFVGPRP